MNLRFQFTSPRKNWIAFLFFDLSNLVTACLVSIDLEVEENTNDHSGRETPATAADLLTIGVAKEMQPTVFVAVKTEPMLTPEEEKRILRDTPGEDDML